MTIKSWIVATLGLGLMLSTSLASAVQVTVTIDEIEITDGDFDAGFPIFRDLIQYDPIFGDFPGRGTVWLPDWDTQYGVCSFAAEPTNELGCDRFVRNPAWVFSTEVDASASPFLFRFVINDEVNDFSDWPLALSPSDNFIGQHERGLYLLIDPSNESWIVRSNPGEINPVESSGTLGAFGFRGDLNGTIRFLVQFDCVPEPEVCDGDDNDCDGLTDAQDPDLPVFMTTCPGDPGVANCTFQVPEACVGGVSTPACPAPDPTETICNGINDDCDAQVDEGAAALPEVCDGADNDCDGNIDAADPTFDAPTIECAGVGPGCTFEVPANCVGGSVVGTCPAPDASETLCNGVDDDCDGRIDEGYQNQRESVVVQPGVCYTTTTFCEAGEEQSTPPVFGDGTPEVPDGINNDCNDDQIDECDPGQTDWWCACSQGDVAFDVDLLDDGFTMPDPANPAGPPIPAPDLAASLCLPTSEPGTGTCNLRGVFRRAEQLDYLGCRVVANLPAGTFVIIDELRLGAGHLLLRGAGSDPSQEICRPEDPPDCAPASTAITTLDPCTAERLQGNGDQDCACSSATSRYRLINAITAQSPEGFPEGVTVATTAALSLSLELEDLILRGGIMEPPLFAFANPGTAGGAVVVSGGAFAARSVFVRDNRARGLGVGLAVFDSPTVEISDSVVTDNFNIQPGLTFGVVPGLAGERCVYTGSAGGFTGFGGGVYLARVGQSTIERSAILSNSSPDGAGVAVVDSDFTLRNSTIAGNVAAGAGGGLYFGRGRATLLFNTITRNLSSFSADASTCASRGGGIYGRGLPGQIPPTLTAFGNLIAQNTTVGASGSQECVLEPGVAGNDGSISCGEPVTVEAAGLNFIGQTGTGCTGLQDAPGNLFGDPEFLIQSTGTLPSGFSSAALVFALLGPDSPALGAYPAVPTVPAGAPPCLEATSSTDQRRALRPATSPCAMGSWEDSFTFADFAPSRAFSGIFVSESLLVRDGARVLAPLSAGSFSIGSDAVISGDASASGDGFLASGASILGDATLGGTLTGDRSHITGTVLEGQDVLPPGLTIRAGSSSGADIEVPFDGLGSLGSGSYGDVLVHSGATLQLTDPGLYRFTSLTFEPDGFLSIAGDFDVALAVDDDLVLGDRFEMAVNGQSSLESDHLFLYSLGALVEFGFDAIVVGNLEAPLAHVEIRDRSFVRGSLAGRSMTIGFDAVVGPRASGERCAAGACIPSACSPTDPFISLTQLFPGVRADGVAFSSNGLTAYVSAGGVNSDIHVATRDDLQSAFGALSPITNVNTDHHERGPWLSPDGLELYFSTDSTASGQPDLVRSTRTSVTAPFGTPQSLSINTSSFDRDPFFAPWSSTLYFASDRVSSQRELFTSSFDGSTFSTPQALAVVNDSSTEDAYPVLTPDGLTLYFKARRSATRRTSIAFDYDGDIWTATRASRSSNFGTPTNVGILNTSGVDFPVAVSADGCSLFIASNRDTGLGGTDDVRLYEAKRGAPPANVSMTVQVIGNTGDSVGSPINCSAGSTCTVTLPYGTVSDPVFANRGALWTGGCEARGSPGLSTDAVFSFTVDSHCIVQFP